MKDLNTWLRGVNEIAIDPALPIVDTHHHCWGTKIPLPHFPPYGYEDILRDVVTSGHNIVGTVYVQAYSHFRKDGPEHLKPIGETEHINALGALSDAIGGKAHNICAGIIGWADLFRGEAVGEVLDAHIAAAPERFKGVRYLTTFDPDNAAHSRGNFAHMLSDARFREGVKELAPRGLIFESMVFHPQISEVTDFARATPDTSIVLNHIGAPMVIGRFEGREAEVFDAWRTSMKELATAPNVVVKLGGLNSPRTGLAFVDSESPPTSQQLADKQGDYIRFCIDTFGPDRCMFESNFPVDMLGASSTVLWNGFKRMTASYGPDERVALFSGTAKRVYGLPSA